MNYRTTKKDADAWNMQDYYPYQNYNSETEASTEWIMFSLNKIKSKENL